jgi:hypothetical protein
VVSARDVFQPSLTILDWSAISLSICGHQHSRYEHVSTNACFRSANVKEEGFVWFSSVRNQRAGLIMTALVFGLMKKFLKLALQMTIMSQKLLLRLTLRRHCLRVALSPISLPVDVA